MRRIILDKTFIKRRYFETRAGISVISPLISASTLIGVAFLYIKEIVPIWIFVPVFVMFMITIATVIGFKFRGIQLATDNDMMYEKSRELNKTLFVMMYTQRNIMLKLDIPVEEKFTERLNQIHKI